MAGIKTELPAGHEVFYTPLYPAPPSHLLSASAADYVQRYQHKQYKLEEKPIFHSTHLIKQFECAETTEAASAVELARHALAQPPGDEKRYKCAHCPKSFKRNDHLKRHIMTQHTETLADYRLSAEESAHTCQLCHKTFKRNDILKRHTMTQHPDSLAVRWPGLSPPPERPHKCPHCPKSFNRNDHLKRHTMTLHAALVPGSELWRAKRLNTEERAFKCAQCDSWYKRNDHLKRHVLSAHSDSPQMHYCPTCDKTFKRRDHLMRHMDTKHTPEDRRFRCADCGEDFVGLENLMSHEQLAHGITPSPRLPCPQCDVTFKRRDHMIRHVNSKHLNQVVNCPLCPSVYKRRDHLIRHLREKHKTSLAPAHADHHLVIVPDQLQQHCS